MSASRKQASRFRPGNSRLRARARKRNRRIRQSLPLAALAVFATLMMADDGSAYRTLRAALADPVDFFTLRSPGERGEGWMLQTKRLRQQMAQAPQRSEKVLSPVKLAPEPSPTPLASITAPLDEVLPPPETPPTTNATIPDGPLIEPVQPPTLNVFGPVPEPSTWMSMIFGMFAVAAALRRGRGRAAPSLGTDAPAG